MDPQKPITFDDIAAYTRFSKTTVSRYFNNPASLTEQTRRIISDALRELHYRENKVARILANGKSEFIGIIVPELYHRYFSDVLNHILATYETFGYKFLVFVGNGDPERERRYIRELLAYRIEGLIVLSQTIPSRELAGLPIPIVTIEREDTFVCSVNTDNYAGGYQAAELLAEHGCDLLVHINSPTDEHLPTYGRIRGFLDCCRAHGLRSEVILRGFDRSYEEDQRLAAEVVDLLDERYPDSSKGLFVSNDTLACTILNRLCRKHGRLPASYRIVGFDNSSASREAVIPLSTVGQQIDVLTQEAVTLLVERIRAYQSGDAATPERPIHRTVAPVLVRRETTERP